MHIASKEKKGYNIGRKVPPIEDNPTFDKWEVEESFVKSWIINSMTNKLISHFVQCGTAKKFGMQLKGAI